MGVLKKLYNSRSSKKIETQKILHNFDSTLFIVLSRYGDAIIAFSIIQEFMEEKKPKTCTVVTSGQLAPYARKMLKNATVKIFNKNSLVSALLTLSHIKKTHFGLGLNPHSFGSESEYLISFCKQFSFFKQHVNIGNLYNKNRQYIGLDKKYSTEIPSLPKNAEQILICPETTEARKAFGKNQLASLISQLKQKYNNCHITLGITSKNSPYYLGEAYSYHFFKKSQKSSQEFLSLLQTQDLLVSVDSGPLHLAKALQTPAIAFFACTAPEIVIDDFSTITPIRTSKLAQIQCENKTCQNPRCLNDLFEDDIFMHVYEPKLQPVIFTKSDCPYDAPCNETWTIEP